MNDEELLVELRELRDEIQGQLDNERVAVPHLYRKLDVLKQLIVERQYKIDGPRIDGGKCSCCSRGGEYNGFGSDGAILFNCPNHCMCHD